MNISEATMLAGVPNAPSLYNPKANIDLTISRQKKVISSMVENNYLTKEEANNIELYNNNWYLLIAKEHKLSTFVFFLLI